MKNYQNPCSTLEMQSSLTQGQVSATYPGDHACVTEIMQVTDKLGNTWEKHCISINNRIQFGKNQRTAITEEPPAN